LRVSANANPSCTHDPIPVTASSLMQTDIASPIHPINFITSFGL
jgi:hypothetical protein